MEEKSNKYLIYDHPINNTLKFRLSKVKMMLRAKLFQLKMNIIYPKNNETKKYYVSICAIFKNEAKYLKEWILFHQIIGIDHFYMYNNNSEDNYKEILEPFIDQGIVTLIEFPYNHAQMQAYTDCIQRFKKESNWIGFIDLDEFLVPIENDNIKDFLKKFEKNRPAVQIYWKLFGTSGLTKRATNSLVIEDFTVCWPKHDMIGKCFFNTKYDFNPDFQYNAGFHHVFWGSYKGHYFPMVNFCNKVCYNLYHPIHTKEFPIQINHYFTKSFNEYVEKASKGDVYFTNNPHNLDYFYRHEMLCTSTDYSAYKYLIKLKQKLEE